MQYKTFHFDIKGVEANEDSTAAFIYGLASTFGNVDREGDIFEKGSFLESISKFSKSNKKIPMPFGHDLNNIIGGYDPARIKETTAGLEVVGELDLNTQQGREKYSLAKKGFLNSFSIGFIANKEHTDFNSKGGRTFKKVELLEISLVAVPANEEANILSVKAVNDRAYPLLDEDVEWDGDKSIEQIRQKTGSEDSPSPTYKNGFLWHDSDKTDSFSSYKLPFVYVENNQFKAVPKSLFAIAGAVSGARGGLSVPEADKTQLMSVLNKYYSKMGRDSPFSKQINCIDEINNAIIQMKLFKAINSF